MVSSEEPVRWGIVGTGHIASAFVADLALLPDAEVVAVGSRRQQTADAFADRFGVPRRHPSYEALFADPDVDVVYVSTPHPGHYPACALALDAGKPVLCEKPFTLNAGEAAQLVSQARRSNLFLMEAMWTRFLPHVVRIRELLAAGALGELSSLQADHGQWFPPDPAHRLFAPELGGGALLDLGIYPVSFASMVLGTPTAVTAVSTPAFTGVDGQTSMLLQHENGSHAVLNTTSLARTPTRAAIVGTEARIEIDATWYAPTTFSVISRDDVLVERFEMPHEGRGLRHQAAEVGRCLRAGELESPVMPLDETVAIMSTLDEVRRQIGLVYPSEGA
jgi:predicted dehydrogenase